MATRMLVYMMRSDLLVGNHTNMGGRIPTPPHFDRGADSVHCAQCIASSLTLPNVLTTSPHTQPRNSAINTPASTASMMASSEMTTKEVFIYAQASQLFNGIL